tara:strand:+ start:39421 stop:42036 length:2616 start_codon:yes stop_codon:yes gene_type:complete
MADSTREIVLIDTNLFSGSTDTFRTAIGGFWEVVSSSEGSELQFETFSDSSPSIGYFDRILARADDPSYVEVVDSEVMVPNKRFPIRVFGDNDNVINDDFWKTIFLGGVYSERTYQKLYNENVFNYHYTSWQTPYPALSASLLSSFGMTEMAITYDYNCYLPEYEAYTNNLDSELLIPNYYVLNDLLTYDTDADDSDLFDPLLLKFVTREDIYENVNSLLNIDRGELIRNFGPTSTKVTSNYTVDLKKFTNLYLTYLTSSVPQTPLSASTIDWAKDKFQNILLDTRAIEKLYKEDSIDSNSEYFPYYVKISFPLDDTGDFCDSINEHDFSTKFIKNLYMSYDNKISSLVPSSSQFASSATYYSGTLDASIYSSVVQTQNVDVRTIDYPKFLAYCHNTYSSSADECMFVGQRNIARDSNTHGGRGSYRYFNSVSSLGVLGDTINYLSNSANFNVSSLEDIYGNTERTVETLAYRIEKIGGAPTGDDRTQNVLQNYWIMNSDMQDFDFFDTQVKYDTDYTYTVYAYKLICGLKYSYSDLLLTKQLMCDMEDGSYGLEFYDPLDADEPRANQIYKTDSGRIQNLNELATTAQTTSNYAYLADMYLNYEPSMQIVEVPVFRKKVSVMDNPPTELVARPYQIIDNSQTVGFEISLGPYIERLYSDGISSDDLIRKEKYLYGKDILSTEEVTSKTVSLPSAIQVYRLSEKPSSISDFDGSLIGTMQIQEENSKYPYTSNWFENIIKTNQKYYYMFRVLNEQQIPSPHSDIYESELVNDGGYIYSVFNVLRETDLQEKIYNKPTKTFKKLIQIKPRYNQVEMRTSELQYSQPASSQVENLEIGTSLDPIWDRTFKFRLTSKKTGKKIDLNITYSLNSE